MLATINHTTNESRREVEPGKRTLLAEDYVSIFRRLGVTCVIRFNKKCYDRRRFIEAGIKHIDLFYEDGGNPSEEILQRFLKICENVKASRTTHARAHDECMYVRTRSNITHNTY